MKRHILDFNTPHIIGNSKNSDGKKQGKTQRRRLSLRLIVLILIVALLALSIAAGIAIYQPFSFRLKKSEYHMLILSRESTLSAAENMQSRITDAGGSGYIINNGEFLVTAFVYTKKSDANLVCERMKEDYNQAEVISYSVGKTKIKRFNSRSMEKMLKNLLNYPISLIDEVIEYVYLLDSFESTESEIMLKAENLKSTLNTKKEQAQSFFSDDFKVSPPVAALYVLNFYSDIYDSLCNVTMLSSSEKKLTHRLKSFACEAVSKYHTLRQQLKQL